MNLENGRATIQRRKQKEWTIKKKHGRSGAIRLLCVFTMTFFALKV